MAPHIFEIPKFQFSEPQHNLPGRKDIVTLEESFTIKFARAYVTQASRVHRKSTRGSFAYAREIPVNGYGIADLVVVAWDNRISIDESHLYDFPISKQPCVRAFECKLNNWRKGLSQANRYRFFANQAIMVLPPAVCRNAIKHITTFKKIRVGLWEFSPETNRVIVHYTPRQIAPPSKRFQMHATQRVFKAFSQVRPIA